MNKIHQQPTNKHIEKKRNQKCLFDPPMIKGSGSPLRRQDSALAGLAALAQRVRRDAASAWLCDDFVLVSADFSAFHSGLGRLTHTCIRQLSEFSEREGPVAIAAWPPNATRLVRVLSGAAPPKAKKKKTTKHVPKAKKKRDVAICEKQRTTIKMFLAATNRDIPSRFVLLLLAPVASLLVAFFIIFIF